ncbi:Fis1p [Ascoidea rubescens DSM 1968]|uniref:Mitochondrial fission 1 protein n=1 Tax=Ascoidea rubescens DSM 1968 TaxID=1344418 RepID=A0A1D2VQ95_9ASCO|nr:mitochondrial fission 1 protein [Ascoidea rubescens DSM 1968]ODV63717.1 mitochondrial fission 1 protein [Ascoidea rubescens DSM 1968]
MSEKKSYLPTLEDANNPLSPEQLEILHQQVVSEGELASIQSKFNYAWGLIKSDKVDDQRKGVKYLTEVFKDSPQRRRECLYYLALGSYKLGDYSDSRRYAEALVNHEPENSQALSLKRMVEDRIAKEGLIGIAILSGAVAVGATLISLMRRKR